MGKLDGKIAIVTGATSGIGRRTVEIFVQEGARVVATGRREEHGRSLEAALGKDKCVFVKADATQEADVEAMIAACLGRWGRLDCLFNNAGGPAPVGGIETIPVDGFDAAMATLVRSVMLGMKHAAPVMMKQGSGSIINNGSVAARRAGYSTSMIYGAAKAAVNHLTVCAAMQLGERNVRCNSISPGGIATGIFAKALGLPADKADGYAEAMKAGFAKNQPIPRAGLTDDIALAAVFLASDDSTFINGHDLVVDGGIVGGRLWTPHQEGVKAMRQAFGVELVIRRALLAALALCLVVLPATAAEPVLTPLVGQVLAVPRPVTGSDQRRHLVYEVQLSNVTAGTLEVQAVEIVDQDGKVVHRLDRDAVAGRLSVGGRRGAESADLLFGQFGVLFVHVALGKDDALPRALRHRIAVRFVPANIDHALTIAETALNDAPAVVLGPPLAGKGYIAGDGCCDSIRHVRALLPLDGRFTLAQRFAIDWEQADAQNRLVSGDTGVLGNYTIFGKEVLAVADGTVVAARNDLPEQVPGALPKNLPLDQADGNFVVLDVGGGVYVLFAHMQLGSVTVTAGARVKRGDVLGKVGNSGNSQAPHLHLHVMDGPSALQANGIPYIIDAFTLTAIDHAGTADFDKAEATGSPLTLTPVVPPQAMKGVLPLDLTVVEFSR